MTEQIDPKHYGLSSRVIILRKQACIIIVKKRKTRIIMKDSKAVMEIISTIRAYEKNMEFKLLVSGPVCSKSVTYLLDNNVEVILDV